MWEAAFDWYSALIQEPEFWVGAVIWTMFVAPIEILVHEVGHLLMQRRYGIGVRFVRIGIGKLWEWKLADGTPFTIGVPTLVGEARMVGEGADWDAERENPLSFSYIHRFPGERFVIAVAGVAFALWVFLLLGWGWWLIASIAHTAMPFWGEVVLGLVYVTEVSNLALPIRISKNYATDGWIAFESLWQLMWWKGGRTPRQSAQ